LPGLLGQILGPAVADNAGVGADDVQAPEFGDAVIEGLLEGAVVADVGLGRDDPAVQSSTSLTVWARSSGVDIGYATEST